MTNAEELIAKLVNDKRITGEEAVILLNEIITKKIRILYISICNVGNIYKSSIKNFYNDINTKLLIFNENKKQ